MSDQLPKQYHPPAPFPDPNDFHFTETLESNYLAIKAELNSLISRKVWSPYFDPTKYQGTARYFLLYARGKKNKPNCRWCPVTTKILESIPNLTYAAFGCLSAGTQILPHRGAPGILRVHLGLLAEPGMCGWRVEGVTRDCVEGKVVIFEDGCLHEAWNNGSSHRVTLICDPPAFHLNADEIERVLRSYQQRYGPGYLFRHWGISKPAAHPYNRYILPGLLYIEPLVDYLHRFLLPIAMFFHNRFGARKAMSNEVKAVEF
jgi:hypothetical protein